jgi:hypothetical protein
MFCSCIPHHNVLLIFLFTTDSKMAMLMVLRLFLAYGTMVLAQLYGTEILGYTSQVGTWMGVESQLQSSANTTMPLAVIQTETMPTTTSETIADDMSSWTELCEAYSEAHFHSYSNILHAGAMYATLVLWVMVVDQLRRKKSTINSEESTTTTAAPPLRYKWLWLLLWIPPIYYLPAWVGHFFVQHDIPAVFTYGTTIQGWWKGETCAWMLLLWGGWTIQTPYEMVLAMIVCNLLLYAVVTPILGEGSTITATKNKRD